MNLNTFQTGKLLLISCFLLLLGCSGTEKLSVSTTDRTPTVDGNLIDWNTTESLLKSTAEVDYYVSRSGEFLYVFVDVKAPMKNAAIRQSGLIFYLNDSEGNRRQKGLGFPPGTLNLLREYPVQFEAFTSEPQWAQNPQNQELMNSLGEGLFSTVMVVERPEGSNRPEFGFIEKTRMEIDGFEIAADTTRRNIALELKIPLQGSSFYNVSGDEVWFGLSIEPPQFDFPDNNNNSVTQNQRRDLYGRRTQSRASRNLAITRSLGQSDEWFILDLR
jgi:hypothetical protein